MTKKIIYLGYVFLLLSLGACSKNQLWKASDLNPEKSLLIPIQGMSCVPSGPLFLSNYQEPGKMGYLDSLGQAEKYLNIPKGSVIHSIGFDTKWNMYLTDMSKHDILILRSGEAVATVYYSDSTMTPEDLAVSKDGILFVSGKSGNGKKSCLFRIEPDSQMTVIDSLPGDISGIALDNTGKILFVSEASQRMVWKYTLNDQAGVLKKEQFVSFPDFGVGSLKCDNAGNLFLCRTDKGTIVIISPLKEIIREIELKGKKPTSLTFGGYNGRTCYVSLEDRGCIERFFTENPGRDWAMLGLK